MQHRDDKKPVPGLPPIQFPPPQPNYHYPYVPNVSHYPPPNLDMYPNRSGFGGGPRHFDHVPPSNLNLPSMGQYMNDGSYGMFQPEKPSDEDRSEPSRPTTSEGHEVKAEPEEDKMDHRKRKRNRTIRSCVPCHNHKRKCDRKRPCGRCTALGLTGSCVYEVDEVRDPDDPSVPETDHLRRRIAELEQVVRELRQRQPRNSVSNADGDGDNKKRRVIVDRFARFKLDEAAMQEIAAAAKINGSGSLELDSAQMIQDEKNYGTEPYSSQLLPGEEMVHDSIGRKTFIGAPAGRSMLRRLAELTSTKSDLLTVPEDAAFTGVFPDMRKTFPFTTIWSHENFSGEIIGLLPSKEESELLLTSWRDEVSAFFQAWHQPTIEGDYRRFFSMTTTEKMAVPLSCFALNLMICSLGAMMRASIAEIFGAKGQTGYVDPKDLSSSRLQSELYLSAAYQALRLCSFLSSPNVHTIQAQIMINIYLLNSERAADSWSIMGSLVRQCVAMGLHVDPVSLDSRVSLREAEVKRRMWWTVAGLDALLCTSFGRPSVVNFCSTRLPIDLDENEMVETAGSAQACKRAPLDTSQPASDHTYHAAYFQLAIPSFELLDRVFHVDGYNRTFKFNSQSPSPAAIVQQPLEINGNTYLDALRLSREIESWYAHVPSGLHFDTEKDKPEILIANRSTTRINQTLALCVKTYMLVLILHRPYLQADPLAYPESTETCFHAAHIILCAYKAMSSTKSSIVWSWWTMSYRAFHAGAVCAFLAIRQPGTDLARKCLEDLRGAILIFEDRISTWNNAHPVQADLVSGLLKLEKLATAATQETMPTTGLTHNPQVFPINPGAGFSGDGFIASQTSVLPQFWASMFGINVEGGN